MLLVKKDIVAKAMPNLKIYTDNIEPTALDQINTLLAQKPFSDCKVRIMPDVHAGAGCVHARMRNRICEYRPERFPEGYSENARRLGHLPGLPGIGTRLCPSAEIG